MEKEEKSNNFSTKDIITLKFRPQNFNEFIGQPQVTVPLINSVKSGKIHHAYLFYGPRGVGKTSAARILAKMLNCTADSIEKPCLKCENCMEISNGISQDVIEIDGASNRGIDEIRNLQSTLVYAPVKSTFKIYIIDEVHMLTKEAFNALLKTLEEPPEHVIFIFATTEIHKVLPTIRSRCQQYQFTLFKITDIVSQIKKILDFYGINYDNEAPALIAKYGNGSMRDALSILAQVIAYDDKQIKIESVNYLLGIYSFDYIKKIIEQIASKDISGIYSICSELYYQGLSIENISNQILEFIRVLTLLKNGIEDINILNQAFTDYDELSSLKDKFTTKKLVIMARKLIEFQKSISLWSNPFYAFENLLISFAFEDLYTSASDILNAANKAMNAISSNFNMIEKKPDEIILKKVPIYDEKIIKSNPPLQTDKIEPGLNKEEKNIEQVSDSSKKMHNNLRFNSKSPEDNGEYLKVQENDNDLNKKNENNSTGKSNISISSELKNILDSKITIDNTVDRIESQEENENRETSRETLFSIKSQNKEDVKSDNLDTDATITKIKSKFQQESSDNEKHDKLENKYEKVEIKKEDANENSNSIIVNLDNGKKENSITQEGDFIVSKENEIEKEKISNKQRIDKFADNISTSLNKEINDSNIPEPFKKLFKYFNGTYYQEDKNV